MTLAQNTETYFHLIFVGYAEEEVAEALANAINRAPHTFTNLAEVYYMDELTLPEDDKPVRWITREKHGCKEGSFENEIPLEFNEKYQMADAIAGAYLAMSLKKDNVTLTVYRR
jgi:hypothetical protein